MDVTVTISEAEAGVTFYYIAATNGLTRVFPDILGIPNFPTFSVVYMASKTMSFDISIMKGTELIDDSQVSFTMTVIGMLILFIGVISIRALDLKPICGMIQFRFMLQMLQFNSGILRRFQFHTDSIPIIIILYILYMYTYIIYNYIYMIITIYVYTCIGSYNVYSSSIYISPSRRRALGAVSKNNYVENRKTVLWFQSVHEMKQV